VASTQTWSEFNGGSLTETASRAECNWKNVDDSTTAYTASVITAGNNSFSKQQCVVFAGTFNSLSALTYKVSTNAPLDNASASGKLGVNAKVINSSYVQGTASSTGDASASTSGTSANFGTTQNTSGFATGTTTAPTPNTTTYTNAYRTQLATSATAGPGDIATVTITASWTES
jgi:hypothetical protein